MNSLHSLRLVLSHGLVFAKKDLRESTRFKLAFFGSLFVGPLVNLGLFGTVFFGFLRSGGSAGGLTQENFVAFTILGALAASLFSQGIGAFNTRLTNEKYWQTASVLLASPLSPWSILVGVGISELAKFFVAASPLLVVAFLVFPIDPASLVEVLFSLVLLYGTISGVALVRGAVVLANEGVDSTIGYALIATGYLSCFYFPLSFVPSLLQPLAQINPIYYVVYLIRATWLQFPHSIAYTTFAIATAITSLTIGTYVFTWIWRNTDISGY